MWVWMERRLQRQRELEQGVDADLVRDNRKRYKLAYTLLGSGFLLALLCAKLNLSGIPRAVAVTLAFVLVMAGVVMGRWAAAESAFLSEPGPEEPPKIFPK
jgi:hypothetical protein